MSEVSTNQSRDVSISSKPFRHDVSLPTADQLPFKQVDNCPQVTTRVNKTFGSGSIRPEERSISASRLDHHATESFPPRGGIVGMTTLKKCGFSISKSLIVVFIVVCTRNVHDTFRCSGESTTTPSSNTFPNSLIETLAIIVDKEKQ